MHPAAVNLVIKRLQGKTLMVRIIYFSRNAGPAIVTVIQNGGIVYRVIKTVTAQKSGFDKPSQVSHGYFRFEG